MSTPALSIIICTFPLKYRFLELCLQSLKMQTFRNFEVIVVNDGNDKQTAEVVSRFYEHLRLTYYPRPNDKCVSRSRNTGASAAASENLVFLDGDIFLNSRAAEHYYSHLEGQNNTSIWGRLNERRFPSDETIPDSRLVFRNPVIRAYSEKADKTAIFMFRPYFYAYSGNFGISKTLFNQSGGFNEEFTGWGHEDIEFGLKVFRNKGRFLFSFTTEGLHLVEETARDNGFYTNHFLKSNESLIDTQLQLEYAEYMMLPEKHILDDWEIILRQSGNDPGIKGFMLKYLEEKRMLGSEL